MARKRVDTRFVIILASVMALAASGLLGVYFYHRRQGNDPEYLRGRAMEYEGKKDWNNAIRKYSEAAGKSTKAKQIAENSMKYADLAYEHSDGPNGAFNYRVALAGWQQALSADPGCVPAGDNLMREVFKVLRTFLDPVSRSPFDARTSLALNPKDGQLTSWMLMSAMSKQILEARPDCGIAHACRAWAAMLPLLQLRTLGTAPQETIDKIKADIEAAIKYAPDDPAGYLVGCDFEMERAALLPVEQDVVRRKRQATAIKKLKDFIDAHENAQDMAADWGNRRMATMVNRDEEEPLYAELRAIYDKAPGNPRLANVLMSLAYVSGKREEGEKYLQDAVAKNPGRSMALWQLAKYDEAVGNLDDEIKNLQSIYAPTNTGKAMDAFLNEGLQSFALEDLPRVQLQVAMREGGGKILTAKGQAAVNEARINIEKLRGINPLDVWVELLDGRLSYAERKTDAVSKLVAADKKASVTMGPNAFPKVWLRNFREAKNYLAEAYVVRGEQQLAVDKYMEVLNELPDDQATRMNIARLYFNMKNYTEANKIYEKMHSENEMFNRADEPTMIRAWAESSRRAGNTDFSDNLLRRVDKIFSEVAKGQQLLSENKFDEAIQQADMIDSMKPGTLESRMIRAVALVGKKDFAAALPILEGLRKEQPNQKDFLRMYIIASYSKDGKPLNDDILSRAMIDMAADPFEKQKQLAEYLWRAGQWQASLDAANEAEKLNAVSPEVIEYKFRCLIALGKFADAAPYVEKAKAMNLDQAQGRLYEGQLALVKATTLQEREAAVVILHDASLMAKDYHVARSMMGDAYLSVGRFDDALGEYLEAVRLKPDDVRDMRLVIRLMVEKGTAESMQRAKAMLTAALIAAPEDRQLRLFEDVISDPKDVIPRRQAAYKRNPEDMENTRQLAWVLARQSRFERTVEAQKADFSAAVALVNEVLKKSSTRGEQEGLQAANWAAGIYRDALQTDKSRPFYVVDEARRTELIDQARALYMPFLNANDLLVRDATKLALGRLYRAVGMSQDGTRALSDLAHNPESPQKDDKGKDIPSAARDARRELADMLFDIGDMAGSEKAYAEIEKAEGASTKVSLRLSETMLNQGHYSEADARLAELQKKEPQNLEAISLSGYSLILQHKLAEAAAKFDQVLKIDPNNINALYYSAYAEFTQQRDLKGAIEDLLRVKEFLKTRGLPPKVESQILLARIYRLQRRYQEAIREYKDVVDLEREATPVLTKVRMEYTEYLEELTEMTKALPEDHRGFRWMDDLMAVDAPQTLKETLERLMVTSPEFPMWSQRYAELMIAQDKRSAAIETLKTASAKWPDAPMLQATYISVLVQEKRYPEAIERASSVLAKWPDFADVYVLRAMAVYATDPDSPRVRMDIESAIEYSGDLRSAFSRARQFVLVIKPEFVSKVLEAKLERDPADLLIKMGLASLYMTTNKSAKIIEMLDPVLKNGSLDDPKNIGARVMVLRTLGDVSFSLGKNKEAMEYYSQILKLDPDDLESLNNSAYIMAEELKKPAEALQLAKRAVNALQTRPTQAVFAAHGNVLDSYGWIIYLNAEKQVEDKQITDIAAKGMYEESRKILQDARDADPLPLTYLHLAHAYEKTGMVREAKVTLDSGITLATAKKDASLAKMTDYKVKLDKVKN